MSDFVIYLKVKPFLQEWLVHHYGDPVRFPSGSTENATIRRFLAKQPPDKTPEVGNKKDTAIYIPDSKQKPVVTYNYLGKHSKEAVIEAIEDTFNLQLWKDLNDLHECGCSILKSVRAWCENNDIDISYDYTLKMRYQRMRSVYLKNDIDLRLQKRNHDK